MAYDLFTGSNDDEQSKIAHLMQLFQTARQQRLNHEVQWEESAALVWPEYRGSFSFGHVRSPGVKYAQFQVDSTSAIKAGRFKAVADAMLTPHNMMWSRYGPTGPDKKYLMKQRDVALHYEQVTQIMWDLRYAPEANFQANQLTAWMSMGVFGNHGMLIEPYDARPLSGKGIRYTVQSPGEIYILVNHQGRVDGAIRQFKLTARQAYQRFKDKIPPVLAAALEKADQYTKFDFLQFILPRHDYDPHMLFSNQGKPWSSIVVSVVGYTIVEEGGFYSFPIPYGRYEVAVEEWYGRGPTQQVLNELKTKNSEKEAFLKQGVLAGDPAYLLPDDGLFDFKVTAGGYVYGGWKDGKPEVGIMPTGQIQITKELMEDSDRNIDAAYLVDLFPALFDKDGRQRSAREVIEVGNQAAIFLAPTLGGQYSDYLYWLARRELDVAKRLGLLPEPPAVLKEAGADYLPHWTSPLARGINAQGIAGFMRTVEMTTQIAQSSQDASVFDIFDFEEAIPEMAEHQYAPTRWMASAQKIAQKRKSRAQQAEREARAKEMPAQAAIIKAQAIGAKAQAGQNIGGTLSGTPQGGMPQIPGNPPGMPGQPGVFGRPGLPGRPA